MKMKFLLALMAGTVALSAQAEFQKCNGRVECRFSKQVIESSIKVMENDTFKTPNGKEIPVSVLKNAKLEAYYDNEKDIALMHSPKANCQQLFVLAKINKFVQEEVELKDPRPVLRFFAEKINEKKCRKSLGV